MKLSERFRSVAPVEKKQVKVSFEGHKTVEDWDLDLMALQTGLEANKLTEWEEGFVSDLLERWEKHGDDMYVSDKQAEVIKKIAFALESR